MPDVRMPDGTIIKDVPEGVTQSQLSARLNKSQEQPKESTLGDIVRQSVEAKLGALEFGASMLTGLLAEPVAGIAGLATGAANIAGVPGLPDSGAAVEATQEALTFRPRTEAGQAIGQAVAPIGEAIEKGEQFLGKTAQDLGAPPSIAAAVQSAPTAALELLGVGAFRRGAKSAKVAATQDEIAKLSARDIAEQKLPEGAPERLPVDVPQSGELVNITPEGEFVPLTQTQLDIQELIDTLPPKAAKTEQTKQIIRAGGTDKEFATLRVDDLNQLRADPKGEAAIKQGFREGTVATIKGSGRPTKQKMNEMLRILSRGRQNEKFAAANRPADVIGRSLADRVKSVASANREAGKKLDTVAKGLAGETVDLSTPIRNFNDALENIGVRFDEAGDLDFSLSDIEGLGPSERLLKTLHKRLNRPNITDAEQAHIAKRFIDNNVTFGRGSEGGLVGDVDFIAKSLRRDIDTVLDDSFPAYDQVNIQYSDTIRALDDFQSAAGKINLHAPNADKALGTLTRRLTSNVQSRADLMNAMDEIESVATRYGDEFKDDILSQVVFSNALDRRFGPPAETGIGGEFSKVAEQGRRAASQSIIETGVRVGAAALDKIKKVDEDRAIEALEKLLRE